MSIDSVAIINPPNPENFISNKDSMGGFGQLYPIGATYFPPTDMPYLISYLDHKKHTVEVIECLGSELDESMLLDKLKDIKDGSLLVIRTSDPTLTYDVKVAENIKKSFPSLLLSLYGPVVEHKIDVLTTDSTFDFLFIGEAEDAVDQLLSGIIPATIPNIVYKDSSGQWHKTETKPLNKDLDRLPFPAWHRMPHEAYQTPKSSSLHHVKFMPVLASRGCPFGCNYCPYPVAQGLPYRHRSANNVVDEIEYLINEFDVNHILFRDPVFSLNKKRVREICAEIIKRNIHKKINWKCETRFDCLDKKTLEAMAAAGCVGINFGIESSDPDVQLQSDRKPITPEEIIEKIKICKDLNIKTFCFFIVGLPGDSIHTILDTIKFSIQLQSDLVQFTAAHPLTGTKLRKWAISQGLIAEEGYAYVSAHSTVMGNDNLTQKQLARLLMLAKFIGNNLINRRGILKDINRQGVIYRSLKRSADYVFHLAALGIFNLGKLAIR